MKHVMDVTPNTHGGAGRKQGRKPLDPANPTESHTITLPADIWRMIEQAGDGNRSAGIRRLLSTEK